MIKVEHLTKIINGRKILDDVSFSLPSTGLVYLGGENGCGKTTLLNILALLDLDYEGAITINGHLMSHKESEVSLYRQNVVSYFFQKENYLSFADVKFNNQLRSTLNGDNDDKIGGIYSNKNYSYLSQGERTILLSSTMLNSPKPIIFYDETTASLSENNALDLITKLLQLSKTSLVVFASHDNVLIEKAPLFLVLGKGKVLKSNIKEEDTKLVCKADNILNRKKLKSKGTKKLRSYLFHKKALLHVLFSLFVSTTLGLVGGFSSIITTDSTALSASYLQEGDTLNLGSSTEGIFDKNKKYYFGVATSSDLTKSDYDELVSLYKDQLKFDVFYYGGKENPVCQLSSDVYDLYNTKKKIHNNYLTVTFDQTQFDVPITKVDGELINQINLDRCEDFVYSSPLYINGAIWENQFVDFDTNVSAYKDVFGVIGKNSFISKSLFEERTGGSVSEGITNETLFLPNDLLKYQAESTTNFPDYKDICLNKAFFDFPNISEVFPNGFATKYSSQIAAFLNPQEILISDDAYKRMSKLITPTGHNTFSLTKSIRSTLECFEKLGLEYSAKPNSKNEETHYSLFTASRGFYYSLPAMTDLFYIIPLPLYCLSLLFIVALVFTCLNNSRSDQKILRSLGFTSTESRFELVSIYCGEIIFALPLSFGITFLILFLQKGALPFLPLQWQSVVILLSLWLTLLLPFLSVFGNSEKRRKNDLQ
jgi:putative ABC transport system ATP-binding protein